LFGIGAASTLQVIPLLLAPIQRAVLLGLHGKHRLAYEVFSARRMTRFVIFRHSIAFVVVAVAARMLSPGLIWPALAAGVTDLGLRYVGERLSDRGVAYRQ